MTAAANGHTARVNYLLRLGADIDYADDRGLTALHHAAYSGWEDTVDSLLSSGANSEAQAVICGTPLHLAAVRGRENVVRLLLRRRAVIDARSDVLGTPLHAACMSGNVACVRALIDRGASQEARGRVYCMRELGRLTWTWTAVDNESGYLCDCQPLGVAVMSRAKAIIRLLASDEGQLNASIRLCPLGNGMQASSAPEIKFWHSFTDLILAACMPGLHDVCGEFIDTGADVNARDGIAFTALMWAAREGILQTCEILIAKGADIDAGNPSDGTALHLAAKHGHVGCVKMLLRRNASATSTMRSGLTPIATAVAFGHLEVVDQFYSHDPSLIYSAGSRGGTLLHEVAAAAALAGDKYDDKAMANYLLKRGVDPLVRDNSGHDCRKYVDSTSMTWK